VREPAPVGGYAVGQHVLHPKFGEGVILDYEGQGSHARVQVSFAEAGAKWLVLAYAKLERL
jgi:DNA helicase-2/ATP-dependent DNA helicase PcrA